MGTVQLELTLDEMSVVIDALKDRRTLCTFTLTSLHATDDERVKARYQIDMINRFIGAPSPTLADQTFAVASALMSGDTPRAERLRDQIYEANPTIPRPSIDLAITNTYLDLVTPTNPPEPALDAHLDDTGD